MSILSKQDLVRLTFIVLIFELMKVGFAQVHSPLCPVNCINQTCYNPPSHPRCTYGCIDISYYGTQCKTKCPSPCVTCDRYFNNKSECYTCIEGRYLTDFNKTCTLLCPLGCTTCSSATNCTKCEPYYYMDETSNICRKCQHNCMSCTSDSKCSPCKARFTGNTCQDCIDGYYGGTCWLACRQRCKSCNSYNQCTMCNNGSYNNYPFVTNCTLTYPPCPAKCTACISSTECTACVDGYYNNATDRSCTNSCLKGCTNCTSGTSCITCKTNFSGDKCDKCVIGQYGEQCEKHCLDNCESCLPGLMCSMNNVCHRSTGYCIACPQNFSGNLCKECKQGQHGNNCELRCSTNCLNNTCHRYTADCTFGCISNLRGSKCDVCVHGYYGVNCMDMCPTNCYTCNRHDGNCIECLGNFYGESCNRCKSGKYGETCEHNCSANCNTTVCNKNDGACSYCKTGYHGETCTQTCPSNCYNNSCKQDSGRCSVCKTGFSGDKCCLQNEFCYACSNNDECKTCVSGMYGTFCNRSCSSNCSGLCAQSNGYCIGCNGHLYGPLCEKTCPSGCLNVRDGQSNCDQNNGQCNDECIHGYHGKMCNNNCSEFCKNKVCNKTGAVCSLGCESGRQGSFCTEEIGDDPGGDNDPPVALIAGVCVGVGALVIVAISILAIRQRGNVKGKSGHENGESSVSYHDCLPLATEPVAGTEGHATPRKSVSQRLEEEDNEVVTFPHYGNQTSNTDYGNIGDIRKIVSVAELEEYLTHTTEDQLREQFKIIYLCVMWVPYVFKLLVYPWEQIVPFLLQVFPVGLIKSHKEARKQENISKNRYAGVYPYDENRVKLQGMSSDFISASYIHGHNKTRAYIASLGPTGTAMDNFNTFWHMVWQETVEKIVVLTNLVESHNMKCEQYWPAPKLTDTYGKISVTNLNEEINAVYTVRIFSIAKGSESRTVTQVHFTAWPDKGVPDHVTSIVEFHYKIKSLKHDFGGPIIVHCSAGIGRTGTYIALDILTEEGDNKGQVDIFNTVMALRQQRVNMVQTPSQYIYLHKDVVHLLTYESKAIPANKFLEIASATSDEDFQDKFERLCATLEEMNNEEIKMKQINRRLSMFNRNGGDIPGSRHRPRLYRLQTIGDGDNDYINAVYIDGFRQRNRFIAAQTPLPETIVDFIKLILQEKCGCVVNLEPENLTVKTIGHYLPPDNQSVTHGHFTLRIIRLTSPDAYTLRELTVKHDGQSERERRVYCFQFNKWPGKENVPSDPMTFLRFINDVKNKANDTSEVDNSILLHCLSGAIKCGLFCAVHNAVEKIEREQEVSIDNIMRQIKYRRRASFPNKDQMKFCYSAVSEYLKLFDAYSNLNLRM